MPSVHPASMNKVQTFQLLLLGRFGCCFFILLLLAFSEENQRKRMVEENSELRKKEVLGNCLSHTFSGPVRRPVLLLLSSLEAAAIPSLGTLLAAFCSIVGLPVLPVWFLASNGEKVYFSAKVRATVESCRLLILITSSSFSHCLQSVRPMWRKQSC